MIRYKYMIFGDKGARYMLNFWMENWGTILVGTAVVVAVAGVILKMYKDKKRGKTSCGCGCSNCQSACGCSHKTDKHT